MASPLALLRAHYLARGVNVETDTLQERLLSDYFENERTLRFYEHKMLVLAIQSIKWPDAEEKRRQLESQYTQMLFPEIRDRRKPFIKRAADVMAKFEGKLFSFTGDEDHLSAKVTTVAKLKAKLEAANADPPIPR